MAVAPARHIGPGGAHRNALLAHHEAGDHFIFHITEGGELAFGEPPHIVMGKANVVLQLLGDL